MFENVRRVSSQFVAYGSADVAILVVNFLLLPVYTRVLTPDEYGVLALLLACEAFVKVVYRWGLDLAFLRFHYDYPDEADKRTLAGTTAIFLLAANGVLSLGLAALAGPLSEGLLGARAHAPLLLLLVLNLFVSNLLFLPFALLSAQQRAARSAAITFARSFSTVVVRLVLVVGLDLGVFGIVLADVIVSVALMVYFAGMLRAMTAPRFSPRMARELLRFGLPRVPQGLMHQGMAVSDRFFLGLYLPLADVGVYLIASSMASLTKLYSVAFSTAWMPFSFDAMRRADAPQLFARMGTYAFALLVFITVGVTTLSECLVVIMTPAVYHPAVRFVPLLAVGIAVQAAASFVTTSLNIAKRSAPLPLATAASAIVTVIGHLTLIPRWGVMGAVTAVCAGQVTLLVSVGLVAQRAYPIPYEWGRLTKVVLLGGLWYVLETSIVTASAWTTLGARMTVLAAFPVGLFLIRFLRPAEMQDVKRMFHMVTRPAR